MTGAAVARKCWEGTRSHGQCSGETREERVGRNREVSLAVGRKTKVGLQPEKHEEDTE